LPLLLAQPDFFPKPIGFENDARSQDNAKATVKRYLGIEEIVQVEKVHQSTNPHPQLAIDDLMLTVWK
jgi:hypothetical protein